MLSLLEASKTLEKNKGKTKDQLAIENTTSFFKMLGELNKKKHKGIYWDIYIPLFNDLAQNDFMDTYYYYTMQSVNDNAQQWLYSYQEKVAELKYWLNNK